jgi:hypothetical protein
MEIAPHATAPDTGSGSLGAGTSCRDSKTVRGSHVEVMPVLTLNITKWAISLLALVPTLHESIRGMFPYRLGGKKDPIKSLLRRRVKACVMH